MESFDMPIPENADKILFAEDLMNCFMFEVGIATKALGTLEKYRQFIRNAFDDTMVNAVRFLVNQLHEFTMVEFKTIIALQYPLTKNLYKSLAFYFRRRYLSEGFIPRKFLFYCVHIANLAAIFAIPGNPKAIRLGVECILVAIKEYDMTSDGWDVLNRTAATYEKTYKEYGKSLRFSRRNDYTYRRGLSKSEIRKIFLIQLLDLDDFVISMDDLEKGMLIALNYLRQIQLRKLNKISVLEGNWSQDRSTSEPETSVPKESESVV